VTIDLFSVDPSAFPNVNPWNHRPTSEQDGLYNCFAWAAERDMLAWWDHLDEPGHYWPETVPRQWTLAAYLASFEAHGYNACSSSDVEGGYEKLAIYVNDSGQPEHAARQQAAGWSSKLGEEEDIWHDAPRVLEGPYYGAVSVYMKRPTKAGLRRIFQFLSALAVPTTWA
jgi:hypothetical protein